MRVRIHRGEGEDVLRIITAAIDKCVLAKGFDVSPEQVVLIASDLIDKYKCDSVEDVLEAIKQGRQSKLAWPEFASRNKFNIDVISHWMSQLLNKKAAARENLLRKYKINDKNPLDGVDYSKYKEKTKKIQEEQKGVGRHQRAHMERVRKQADQVIKEHKNKRT